MTRALRVLVVEDEAVAAMDLELVLEDLGYEPCGIASSAPEAVRLADATGPDLVIMDVRLADGTDGVDAANEIRRRLGVRAVFLTAHSDPVTLERIRTADPWEVLAKPYSRSQLAAALARAAGRPR
ncbi:response regulator [Azospirillum halopraeferens]|uniref:response regulator n=1 Tax=Azospirillum halopraeferens TaxID=34010 RepID=UPI00054D9796|nr:response regulator [Azospirillum halopraeferens]